MNAEFDELSWRSRLAGQVAGSLAHTAVNTLAMIGVMSWKIKRLADTPTASHSIKASAEEIGRVVDSESKVLRALSALTSVEGPDLEGDKDAESLCEVVEPVVLLARIQLKARSVAFESDDIPDAKLVCHPAALIRSLLCLLLRAGEALTPFEKKKVSFRFSEGEGLLAISILASGQSEKQDAAVFLPGDDDEKKHVEAVIRSHGGILEVVPGNEPAACLSVRIRFPVEKT